MPFNHILLGSFIHLDFCTLTTSAERLHFLPFNFCIGSMVCGQLFNECGAAVWGTSAHDPDSVEVHARWGILNEEVRDVEVVWSPVHRDMLGRLLLEQLQVKRRAT